MQEIDAFRIGAEALRSHLAALRQNGISHGPQVQEHLEAAEALERASSEPRATALVIRADQETMRALLPYSFMHSRTSSIHALLILPETEVDDEELRNIMERASGHDFIYIEEEPDNSSGVRYGN